MSWNFNSFPVSVLRAQQVGPELILNPRHSQGHGPPGTQMSEGLFARASTIMAVITAGVLCACLCSYCFTYKKSFLLV